MPLCQAVPIKRNPLPFPLSNLKRQHPFDNLSSPLRPPDVEKTAGLCCSSLNLLWGSSDLMNRGSSPSRVGDFGLISYRVEHAGEDFQAQVLLGA